MTLLGNQRFLALTINTIDEIHDLNQKIESKLNELPQASLSSPSHFVFRNSKEEDVYFARSFLGNSPDYAKDRFLIVDSRQCEVEFLEEDDFLEALMAQIDSKQAFYGEIVRQVKNDLVSFRLRLARGGRVPLKYL